MKSSTQIVFYLSFLLLNSCILINDYAINYVEVQNSENIRDKVLLDEGISPDVKIIKEEKVFLNEVSNLRPMGFQLIGYSIFNSTMSIDKFAASELAKKIGATKVLITEGFSHNVSNNYYISGNQGFEYKGSTFSYKQEGTPDKVVSSNYSVYKQTAIFLVKSTFQPNYGILVDNLDTELRQKLKRNLGVIVTLVYIDSYMFNANIIEGDIIIEINDIEIKNIEDFNEAIQSIKIRDSSIKLKLLRDEETIEKIVNI
jgi:hypothetical protein